MPRQHLLLFKLGILLFFFCSSSVLVNIDTEMSSLLCFKQSGASLNIFSSGYVGCRCVSLEMSRDLCFNDVMAFKHYLGCVRAVETRDDDHELQY